MLARKNYGAGTVAPAVAATDRAAGRPLRTGANRAAWTCLAACTAAAALLQLDGTLITVALPSVARNLDLRNDSTSIVLSAYFAADAEHSVSYPSYQVSTAALTGIVPQGLLGAPTTIFINAAGKLVDVHTGEYESQGSLDGDVETYALGR